MKPNKNVISTWAKCKKMKKCRSLNFFKDPQSFNMQKIKNVMKFKNGKIDLNHFWAKLSKEF